jgi:DNA-binding NarL/FixJ family response regulator
VTGAPRVPGDPAGDPRAALTRARAAVERGDVEAALECLDQVLADPRAAPAALADAHFLLGAIRYADDELDAARDELAAAYRAYRVAGEPCRAARSAMTLAELHSGSFGERAVAQGWLARARRLLDEVGPCVEWGWYELAFAACDRPDVDDLHASADRALRIAQQFGDTDLEVRALADGGLALVSQGRLREGVAQLDEAMAAILAGDVRDPGVAGLSFCAMLSACDRTGDVQRAEEWMRVVETQLLQPTGGRPRVLHTHCRLAYGSVLTSAGRWQEAEREMLDALGPRASRSLGHRVEATARLAELRVHQGRVDEAVELLAAHEDSVSVSLPRAQVHLRRGEPDLAIAVAQRGLRDLVGDVMRAAPLLAILVEAEIERGDVHAAAQAANALAEHAAATGAPLVQAHAHLAAARVHAARGEHDAAIAAFGNVPRALPSDDRPLLGAIARAELAGVLADSGDVPGAIVEARAALGAFDRLGASGYVDRTRALLRRLGASTGTRGVGGPRPADRLSGLTAREAEVLSLLRDGLTNTEIGARLFISAKTAEHHVGRILTKLGVRTRAEAAAVAAVATYVTGERATGAGPARDGGAP